MTCAINVEASDAKVIDLRVNDLVAPVGIDTPNPIFSWKMDSDAIGAAQTEYKIVVKAQGGNTAWDSGWVKSGNSVAIRYNGKALASQTKYEVSVTIKDQNGGVTEAATTTFVTAFFEENAFDDTKWISYQDSTMASLTKYTIDFDFKITEAAQGFKVTVVDGDGNAVPGVIVQICKDSCVPARTDDNGVASFNIAIEDGHKLSVMSCPEGYEYTGEAEVYLEEGATEYTLEISKVG
jgi:hypothetical protein